jgi:hypothetical protein
VSSRSVDSCAPRPADRTEPAKRRPPSLRAVTDERLKSDIARVHAGNFGVYGARKVWHALRREGVAVARCTVEWDFRADHPEQLWVALECHALAGLTPRRQGEVPCDGTGVGAVGRVVQDCSPTRGCSDQVISA